MKNINTVTVNKKSGQSLVLHLCVMDFHRTHGFSNDFLSIIFNVLSSLYQIITGFFLNDICVNKNYSRLDKLLNDFLSLVSRKLRNHQ